MCVYVYLIICLILKIQLFRRWGVSGINYNDNESIFSHIPDAWWLEGESCKWMLSVLVHKDNPDVCSDPTAVAAGTTRALARKEKQKALVEERVMEKAKIPIETHGDVDNQIKKSKDRRD